MELYERIKYLRKEVLSMSQEEFGATLGVNRDVINNIERNRLKKPEQKEPLYQLICTKFNINDNWLRTGEGEIHQRNSSMEDEAAYYVGELLKEYKDNPFYDMVIDMMKTYCELDPYSKKVIRDSVKKLQKNMKARESKSSPAPQDI